MACAPWAVPIKPPQSKKTTQKIPVALIALVLAAVALVVIFVDGTKERRYVADIAIKDYGTVSVELREDVAPITVENFISLAEDGFYDGLTFHRIVEGFMMQGGDPNADGTGGSEEKIMGEFDYNGYRNTLSHVRGTISMARRGDDPDSASSQFFIVHSDDYSASLDGMYAAFGTVISGMEIVDEICASAEPIDENGLIAREKQPVIETITIHKSI